MDKFQRVEKPKAEAAPINENEIRITAQGRMRNYITYATTLLQEKGSDEIILKAMGRAINKTVMIAELIKFLLLPEKDCWSPSNTSIGSTDITDVYEPLEEGLDGYETIYSSMFLSCKEYSACFNDHYYFVEDGASYILYRVSHLDFCLDAMDDTNPSSADQVKPLNDFEDNGGDRYVIVYVSEVTNTMRVRLDSEVGVVEITMELGIIMEMVGWDGRRGRAGRGGSLGGVRWKRLWSGGRGGQSVDYDYVEGAPAQAVVRFPVGASRQRKRPWSRRNTRLEG
ncbi:hypothetical protein GBA52_028476 [Prunus armeniaca]|nr:hypothetical protein GBA52_028476 [Prunus armeniaca]